MIPLYSPPAAAALLPTTLVAKLQLVPLHSWPKYCRAAAAARCSVVLLEWLFDKHAFARLAAFRQFAPDHPLVLVTRRDPDNLIWLKEIVLEEVVWVDQMQEQLELAIDSAIARDRLAQLATQLDALDSLPRPLRDTLVQALRAARPFRSVEDLSLAVGRDRRTLSRSWRASVRPDATLRLQDVVDWLLLLHALRRRRAPMKWSAVAMELGVHEQTLRRLGARLMAASLKDLERVTLPVLVARFEDLLWRSLQGIAE